MGVADDALAFLGQSLLRSVELVLALTVLAVTGFAVWLVLTQPGGPGAGGVVVGLILLAGIASILLAVTILLHVGVDIVRYVSG